MCPTPIPAEHLRAILDALPDGIGIEREGRIIWANLGFARIYGYADESEVLGRSLDSFVAPADLQRLVDYSARRQRGEPVPSHYHFRGLRQDGSSVEIEIFVASYVRDGHVHVLGALRDITEHTALARRVEQSQKLEALGTLARGIAHDFNNLLTTIIGNITLAEELLKQQQAPQRVLSRAYGAAEKAAHLTRQLQAFSGRQAQARCVAEAATLVRDTIELLEHSTGPDLRVTIEAEPSLEPAAIPPDQLQQIVMNLALNAVDAMGGQGQLSIRLSSARGATDEPFPGAMPVRYLRLEVQDDGPGIDPSVLPRIFEPFFTTKPVGEGTGLGLSVVFGTVRNNRGWVEARSTRGTGSCFVVWLPVASQPEPAVHLEPPAPPATPGSAQVLVVDDDAQVRTLFTEILELHGYTVVTAECCQRAVDTMRRQQEEGQPIDLAMIDLVMPGRDGVDCLHALRQLVPDLPAVLCTGADLDHRLTDQQFDPPVEVLRKPFMVDALLEVLQRKLQG